MFLTATPADQDLAKTVLKNSVSSSMPMTISNVCMSISFI